MNHARTPDLTIKRTTRFERPAPQSRLGTQSIDCCSAQLITAASITRLLRMTPTKH